MRTEKPGEKCCTCNYCTALDRI